MEMRVVLSGSLETPRFRKLECHFFFSFSLSASAFTGKRREKGPVICHDSPLKLDST